MFLQKKKKGSILRVIRRFCCWNQIIFFRVQFFESFCQEGSILWVMLKKSFNSLSYVEKSVRFCGSYQKNSILCIISQKFNPFFGSYQKESSILWVIFSKKKFNSLSHLEKSILWVIWRKRCSILWVILENKEFNSVSHSQKKFCASYSRKEMFNSVRQKFEKKRCSILCVKLKKRFNALSQFQIFESYSKNFKSLSHMKRFKKKKKLNSQSYL